jgi:hypothetical protein
MKNSAGERSALQGARLVQKPCSTHTLSGSETGRKSANRSKSSSTRRGATRHPKELPPHVLQAYLDLNDAIGLKSEGVDAAPDADREGFDPQDSFEAANEEGASFGEGINLGGLLDPLRQLSYWAMKKRARTVGEGGMHNFLKELQEATAVQNTRIHLMGHSFGTIVVSGIPFACTLHRAISNALIYPQALPRRSLQQRDGRYAESRRVSYLKPVAKPGPAEFRALEPSRIFNEQIVRAIAEEPDGVRRRSLGGWIVRREDEERRSHV